MSYPFQWLQGSLRKAGVVVSSVIVALHLFFLYGHFIPFLQPLVHTVPLWRVFPANAFLVLLFAAFAGLVYGFWGGLTAFLYYAVVLAGFFPGLPGREATPEAVTDYIAQVVSLGAVGAVIYALNMVGAVARRRLRQALADLQASQEERVRQERLAAIGQAVTAIVHDLRNSLGVISGFAELLGEQTADPNARRALARIREAAQNASRLVSDMRLFAGYAPLQIERIDLRALLKEVTEGNPWGVPIQVDVPPEIPPLLADKVQLMRVFTNLLDNARDALEGRPDGQVRITARAVGVEVVLTVSDNGPGIPPHLQQRVFEPFFTTKPAGKGTGLGLSICQSIVQRHGGRITLQSLPGQGATFIIALPLAGPPSAGVQQPLKVGAQPRG
ncbi:Globin-coupled histidine kinase [bacterium HR23]|nr:Globin-coupled histidine kinase [bacterium HR23]